MTVTASFASRPLLAACPLRATSASVAVEQLDTIESPLAAGIRKTKYSRRAFISGCHKIVGTSHNDKIIKRCLPLVLQISRRETERREWFCRQSVVLIFAGFRT